MFAKSALILPVCLAVFLLFCCTHSAGQEKPVLSPSADSIKNKVNAFALLNGSGPVAATSKDALKAYTDSLDKLPAKKIASVKKLASQKFTDAKEGLLKSVKDSSARKLTFDLAAESNTRYQSEEPFGGKTALQNVFNISGGLNIGKIPLKADYSYILGKSAAGQATGSDNLFKFDFDKEKYAQMGMSSIQKFQGLKSKLKGMDIESFARQKLSQKVASLKSAGTSKVSGAFVQRSALLSSFISKSGNIKELLAMDEKSLKQKLHAILQNELPPLPEPANALKALEEQPGQGIEKAKGLAPATADITFLKDDIDSIAAAVSGLKSMLAASGLDLQTLLKIESEFEKGNIPADELIGLVPQEAPAGKLLHKALSAVKDFKTGAFADKVPGGQFNRDVFMNGFSISLARSVKSLTLGYGSTKDMGYQKDAGFTGSVFGPAARSLAFVSLKTNSSAFLNGKLSWVNSLNHDAGNAAGLGAMPRNNMAFTLTQAVKTGKSGNLTVDISKSGSQYRNTIGPGVDQVLASRNALRSYLTDDTYQTISTSIGHAAELKRAGLSESVYFSYAGSGYQDPASNGFGFAKMKMGGNISKSFYKNRLNMKVRSDFQSTPISIGTPGKWKNYQVQLDSRYAIGRKYTLNLKYMANGTDRVSGLRTPVYSSQKLQVDGNASYRIGNWFANSHFNIAKQDLVNKYITNVSGKLLMATWAQAIVMGKNSLSASVFYNKELSAYKLIGNMLNTDLNFQYSLFGTISSSTGITYLSNQDVARQAGIKQNFQLLAAKSFDISAYVDIRKNMIKPLYPELYSACRAEVSLQYFFNKKQWK